MSSRGPQGAGKRRIGGHFGSAVGSSTKRQRDASWRDEVDEDAGDGAPSAAAPGVDADSESEAPIDPGTPLPSDAEDEGTAAAQAPAPAAAAEAAAGDGALPGAGAAAGAAPGAGAAAPGGAEAAAAAERQGGAAGEGAARPAARDPVVIQLELLIGEAAQGRLHVLLQAGLDGDIEKRLAACLAPSGAAVEALAAGAACAFAGHGPLPRHAPRARAEPEPAAAEPAEPAEPGAAEPAASEEAAAGAAGAEAPVEPVEAQDDPCEHCTTGLLSAPRQGPGLLLTLGPQAHLDDSHQVLGTVLGGRRTFQRLAALAPLVRGSTAPLQPAFLRAVGPEATAAGSGAGPHPFLLVEEPAADSELVAGPFAREGEGGATAGEVLEVVDLHINSRDAEVAELKQKPFGRERQEAVATIEDALAALQGRLGGLEGLGEADAHQRSWLQERSSHLLRILKKLR